MKRVTCLLKVELRGAVSHLTWPELTKMVTFYSLLINNINDRLETFTEQCLIVLCRVFFFSFFLAGLAVSLLDVVCLFSKAQNRGQGIGDSLSDSSENQNIETL